TFFFIDYEGSRTRQGTTFNNVVPTTKELAGDFTGGRPVYDPLTTREDAEFRARRLSGESDSIRAVVAAGGVLPSGVPRSQLRRGPLRVLARTCARQRQIRCQDQHQSQRA